MIGTLVGIFINKMELLIMKTYKVHNNEQIPHYVRNDGTLLGMGGFVFSIGKADAENKSSCSARQLSFRTARSAVRNLHQKPQSLFVTKRNAVRNLINNE